MFCSVLVSLALAASALANVYLTSPTHSTVFTAGQPATLSWIDDGNPPSLAQFGSATFGIYVGNSVEQTPLQIIPGSVDVSSTGSLTFTPDGTIGPNSNEYFIRVTSTSYMNPQTPQYPQEAFSATFSLTSMTGTFNSTIQSEINGQSTAPIGGVTTSSGSATMATSSGTMSSMVTSTLSASTSSTSSTSKTTASASASTASSAASGTPSTTSGAGKPIIATGFVALAAAFVGASLL